ncbi:hypothetical protein HDV04_004949 [Boothiomyces sp. JEL0838]|nr:hypothetical protein HDV04_004949 [Boothiomyces sp. JEL0838]
MDFVFKVRQQPLTGREAGLAKPYTKTNLNPIPIFEIVFGSDLTREQLLAKSFLCSIILVGADNHIQHTLIGGVSAFKRYHDNILGRTTVEGIVLTDPENGDPKIFFIFNDLYIKTPGEYRFLCKLTDMSDRNSMITTLQTSIFTVNNLNTIPKVKIAPTVLTQSFEVQGYDIKYRQRYTV